MAAKQKEQIYRYLLGDLPEAEQLALEQAYFADSEKLEQIWAAENDLVDDYVRGRLKGKTREQFERHYLASARNRERVAFARTLCQEAEKAARTVTEARSSFSWKQILDGLLKGPTLAAGLAVALLMLVLGGTWLVLERSRFQVQVADLRNETDRQQNREKELQGQLKTQRTKADELATELDSLRERQRVEAENQSLQPPMPSLLLTGNPTRGGGNPLQLSISKKTPRIQLKLRTENSDFNTYQADLRTVEGEEIWSSQSLKARNSGKVRAVVLTIPAKRLRSGDYVVRLSGVAANGTTEEVNAYYFRVNVK